ncbi:MAG: Na+/H+ antiporter subunit E [Bacillota bacterium]|nr:Na+/H+ antiporter subunit E [Eubacteriales bacterium]MDI9491834.1 Na+/H+ antiporter subunit E [Bacillota bacterium]NLV70733.1 Na+/H+ antiporter subunit E [Clostridiales bacterium]MDD3536837.1 Na+/H+ antiporter subunit E [Eubacteriales bacterium]MDD4285891.1 Na+/H+ antiporter subunit E [Eubacteriales bacterium]
MFLILLALWLIFNGRMTPEILVFGILLTSLLLGFACRHMDYSIEKERRVLRLSIQVVLYVGALIGEIWKANLASIPYIFRRIRKPAPRIIRFRTGLRTQTARVVLANSITLTPGTITVSLEDEVFTVHCLDASLAEDIQTSGLVRRLRRMEEVSGK